MICNCDEAFLHDEVSGKRTRRLFPERDRRHDCDYVAVRNKLIPEAERIATAEFDPAKDLMIWSQRFHEVMKLLWRESKASMPEWIYNDSAKGLPSSDDLFTPYEVL